jgi:ABC-type branched-subunit amino acid transport system ATPase component/ABC-type branched-subunit amino acid transport system permease subunit
MASPNTVLLNSLLGRRRRWIGILVILAVYLIPLSMSSFNLLKIDEIVAFSMLVVGLNITIAVAGQEVIGLAAVYAFGGYCAVVISQSFITMGLLGMCVVGVVGALLSGAILALPSLRIGGFYLGLTTVFFAMVIPLIASNWNVTGGQVGINLFSILSFNPWLSGWVEYAILLTAAVLAAIFTGALISSRLGRKFAVLRTSQDLTKSLGISTYRSQLLAVLIGAAFCGLGAGMYVYSQQFFSPGSASVTFVILALAAMVIGGAGTVWGPLVGAFIVFGLNTFISFSEYSGIVFGVILLGFVMFAPGGARDLLKITGVMSRLSRSSRIAVSGTGPEGVVDPKSSPSGSTAAPQSSSNVRSDLSTSPGSIDFATAGSGLRVDGAEKSFGGVKAVAGVDLIVRPGTIHGLIGSNGSGKTTLLNLVSGFYQLDGGEIRLDGVLLNKLTTHAVAQAGVARTFQTPKLIASGTALDNVLVASEQRHRASDFTSVLRLGSSRRVGREAVDSAHAALSELGLEQYANQRASGLSHGLQRLVEIARAVAFEPRYILMDEPGAGLSVAEMEVLRYSVRRLADKGVGVLLIEHNVPMVLEVADEVTAMHEGTVLFHGTPAELRENSSVADAFLGEVLKAEEQAEEQSQAPRGEVGSK